MQSLMLLVFSAKIELTDDGVSLTLDIEVSEKVEE